MVLYGLVYGLAMTLYETEAAEEVRQEKAAQKPGAAKQKPKEEEINPDFRNLLIYRDCMSACAYLKEKNIKPDLVYLIGCTSACLQSAR